MRGAARPRVDASGSYIGGRRRREVAEIVPLLGAPVYAADVPDAAALGAASRAPTARRALARCSTRSCRRTAPARRRPIVARPRHAELYTPYVVARYLRSSTTLLG